MVARGTTGDEETAAERGCSQSWTKERKNIFIRGLTKRKVCDIIKEAEKNNTFLYPLYKGLQPI